MKLNRRQFIQLGVVKITSIQALGCSKGSTPNQTASVIETNPDTSTETVIETNPDSTDKLTIDNTFTTVDTLLTFIG